MKPKLLSYFTPALLAGPVLLAADQLQLKLPSGYVISPSSVSPNREYGVSAFDNTVNPIHTPKPLAKAIMQIFLLFLALREPSSGTFLIAGAISLGLLAIFLHHKLD